MKTHKQTLRQALTCLRNGGMGDVYTCGLDGCPEGGWPETMQARRRMVDALPKLERRAYGVDDIIAALYETDHAGRYRVRV